MLLLLLIVGLTFLYYYYYYYYYPRPFQASSEASAQSQNHKGMQNSSSQGRTYTQSHTTEILLYQVCSACLFYLELEGVYLKKRQLSFHY